MSVNRNETKLSQVSDDIEDIQEDVEGIEQDVDEIQKDIDEIHDEIEEDPDTKHLEHIKKTLASLIREMELLHSHTETSTKKKDDSVTLL
jgi:chromosome segregation ATPase